MRARGLLGVALITIAFPGCIGPDDAPAAEPASLGPLPDVRPELVVPTFLPPILLGGAGIGAEPSIAVAPDDTVYVTSPLYIWRSSDGGATYEAIGEPYCEVDPVFGTPEPAVCPPGFTSHDAGLRGGGDGDHAIDATGRIHWAGLAGGPDGAIPYQYSDDRGETWSEPFDVTDGESADREWIAVRPDGRVYVSWRAFTSDDSFIGFRMSPNAGAKWGKIVEVTDDRLAGPVVFAPDAEVLYIPFIDEGAKLARSHDDGKTWDILTVAEFPPISLPDPVGFGSFFRTSIFPVAAVDSAGTIYVVWSIDMDATGETGVKELARPAVYLSVSKDHGETWTEPLQVSPEGRSAIFPWVAAGAPGRIALAYYVNRVGAPSDAVPDLWDVALLESVTADAQSPEFAAGMLNADPIHLGAICSEGGLCLLKGKDRSLLDFFEVAIRPNGQPVVTWAADGPLRAGIMSRVHVYAGGVAEGTPLV